MYCIMRFQKHKDGSARSLEAHHERQKDLYISNPDIDKSRTPENFHIIKPDGWYRNEISNRIAASGCRVRKDSVMLVDTLITASPEFFVGKTAGETEEYFRHAVTFMKDKLGEDNIFSAVVHMDEKTPHLHLCFVPLTADNRLSAKEILGNRVKMSQWQTEFHAHMSEKWSDLKRGNPAVETQREHIPMQLFKRATKLDAGIGEIRKAIESISILNAGKKREEAISMLSHWLPEAQSFTAEIGSVDNYIKSLENTTKSQGNQIQSLQDKTLDKDMQLGITKNEMVRLRKRIKEQEKLLDMIPPDVIAEIGKLYKKEQKERGR